MPFCRACGANIGEAPLCMHCGTAVGGMGHAGTTQPPIHNQAVEVNTGTYRVGYDIPDGDLCIETLGVPEYDLCWQIHNSPNGGEAEFDGFFKTKTYVRVNAGQYLHIDCVDDIPVRITRL
jgi:hypothetical protein